MCQQEDITDSKSILRMYELKKYVWLTNEGINECVNELQ